MSKELLAIIEQNPLGVLSVNDYDGTNAPIVPVPSEAKPDQQAKQALLSMQDLDPTSVFFITGREVGVVDDLCDLEEERKGDYFQNIAGQHGAELRLKGEKVPTTVLTSAELGFLDEVKMGAKTFVFQILKTHESCDDLFPLLEAEVMEKVFEEKPLSFALHTRALKAALNEVGFADTDALIAFLDEAFEKYVNDLSETVPKFIEHTEGFPVFSPEIAEMTYELKLHKAKANKGKVLEELLAHDIFKDKNIILWAGDDLKGTDGDVADYLRSDKFCESDKKAFIIQVLREGDERKEYNEANYEEAFKASRKPDFVFESPAAYGEFLLQVAALQQEAMKSKRRDKVSATVLTSGQFENALEAGVSPCPTPSGFSSSSRT